MVLIMVSDVSLKDLLSENFQDNPSFTIPSRNFYLNLTGEPPEPNSYYSFISYMKTLLISYDGEYNSNNVVRVCKLYLECVCSCI